MLQLICILILNLTFAVLGGNNPRLRAFSYFTSLLLLVMVVFGWSGLTTVR